MIIITGVAFEQQVVGASPSLVIQAAWLDGLRYQYVIDGRGLKVLGFPGRPCRRSFLAIRGFTMLVHDDVWSLFLRQRFGTLRRTWGEIRALVSNRATDFLNDEEIGTAFGVAAHRDVADYLRSVGYRVQVLNWVDTIRTTEAALVGAK